MKNYILFSPIGGNDPISNLHDGAMLHISRAYIPKKIYLYLTSEMLERENRDNRYTATISELGNYLNHSFEVHKIERPDIVDVHLFDRFYKDFEETINLIHKQNEDAEILVNITSGTPAMISALYVIASLSKFKITAIQVATPNKKENTSKDKIDDYDTETYFSLNADNDENFLNRCTVALDENFSSKVSKETIVKLVNAYNYEAALLVAETITPFISENSLSYIKAAAHRLQLDQSGYSKALNGKTVNFMPFNESDKRKIFEYVLMLSVKEKQGNYSDFIRGLTPVLLPIFEICLKNSCGINIKDFCFEHKGRFATTYRMSSDVMMKTEKGKKILDILNSEFKGGFHDNIEYSTTYIFPIIKAFSTDSELVTALEKLENVRSKVRNPVAHEIIGVTDDWVKNKSGLSAKQIMKEIKTCIAKAGFNISKNSWSSYEDMNITIINSLFES